MYDNKSVHYMESVKSLIQSDEKHLHVLNTYMY